MIQFTQEEINDLISSLSLSLDAKGTNIFCINFDFNEIQGSS